MTRALYLKVTSDAEYNLYTYKPGKRPPMFLPVSRGVERELRDHYNIGPAPVKIVPNAADLNIFKPIPEEQRLEWRRNNGLNADDVVLIFAGGEWVRKGLDLAIRALSLVPDKKAKLFIAGDDPAKETLKELAAECGVTDRVIFGGFRKDVPMALASSDIFLFPSWYEAFSLATIEAAACGLPVVATSINGTEDFIQSGINGDFVKSDPKNIAEVITPLIQNPELRATMGRNARQLVEQSYTWDRVTQATEDAYKEYLAGGQMSNTQRSSRVFWFATKGSGTNDAVRIDTLLSKFEDRKEIQFSKKLKVAGLLGIMKTVAFEKPDLIVMEGTGIAGGAACLCGKLLHGVPLRDQQRRCCRSVHARSPHGDRSAFRGIRAPALPSLGGIHRLDALSLRARDDIWGPAGDDRGWLAARRESLARRLAREQEKNARAVRHFAGRDRGRNRGSVGMECKEAILLRMGSG